MHPTVPQIMLLWQAFLNNFDPLVKLFHAPTAQITMSDVATNLENISPGTEALVFAIYLSATVTMTEQQCAQILKASKPEVVKRFSNATQQALVNAKFLKSSDPSVLQALTLYLVREHYRTDHMRVILTRIRCFVARGSQLYRQTSLMDPSRNCGKVRREH